MSDAPRAPRTRLEEIRLARGLKSAELARRAGVDPSNLHKIERGASRMPHGRAYVRRLAEALMVPVEQLYAEIGMPIPFLVRDPGEVTARPYQPDHAPPEIGLRLRAVLADLGVSAEAMARMIGATEADMRDWIAGREAPPQRLMNRLANRAAITLAWLYFGDTAGLMPGVAARLQRLLPPDE